MKKNLFTVSGGSGIFFLKKNLLKMKLTFLCLLLSFVQLMANDGFSQSTRITLNLKDACVEDVLMKIEEQSDLYFIYNRDIVNVNRKVNVSYTDQKISDILTDLFNGTNVTFEVQDRHIVLKSSDVSSQQQKSVSGKTTDSLGAPLPGVTILVKGTTTGTITDFDGNYSLTNVPVGATLVFSFVGMKTQEIPVAGKTNINVVMDEETVGIEEIVTIGYGIQKKTSITSAVSKMGGEELASIPITTLSNGIGGRVSGVITRQASGQPGQDGSSIYIRGISSTGSSSPLIIVDGIPRAFDHLDPNTIESFTILKDAAAVAPYGVAGANGVILVTTKKGRIEKPTFRYHSYVGFQNPTSIPDILDAYQYCNLKNIAAENVGLPHVWSDEELQKYKDGSDPDLYPSQNAYDLFVKKNTLITNHNFELSGGTERVKYYTSIGYMRQNGYWTTNYKDKFNYSMDLEVKATNTTQVTMSMKGREQQNMYPGLEGTNGVWYTWEVLRAALPYQPIVFSNGLYGRTIGPSIYGSGYWKEKINQVLSQISLTQQLPFIKGLSFKATVAYDTQNMLSTVWYEPRVVWSIKNKTVQPFEFVSSVAGQAQASLSKSYSKTIQFVSQTSLNYTRSFDKHSISALLLFETNETNFENLYAKRQNYELDIDELNMGSSSQADISNSGYSTKARQMGYVFRLNYDFATKYLVELSGRYDGHYYFAPDKKYGFFPAVSLGYRISQENFMKSIGWIDNLKIRASLGEVGALAGSAYQYLSSYAVGSNAGVIAGSTKTGLSESSEANTNITWERARKTDIGVDGTFWKGLLSVEADYFYEYRRNMLVTPDVVVPVEYGISISQVNKGEMENKGIDFTIGSNYKFSQDLKISLNGTFTYAKNKLLQVYETSATYDNPYRRKTGRPLNAQYGYVSMGYFQVEDFDSNGKLLPEIATQPWGTVKAGDIRYEDINGDGKITEYDQTLIGDPIVPLIIYGLGGDIQYKNFSFNFLFQGTEKSSIYKANSAAWLFNNNYTAHVENLDYWTTENRNALNPRPTPTPTTNNNRQSSHWVKDCSYLRLKSATLSYKIPASIIQKLRFENATVFVSGQNLLTFTKFTNYDPELSAADANFYPQTKVVSLGVNISF
ncbi:MAG TPA: TonB-dependent receptor [Prolixibacteraceae bacterium]|nr:TonB-dependent receptor [Prolixibacteraceae bacterium]HCR91044.1 TonB-dependent receptor [Prolixibacteraceae bacterium]HCU62613.1 TonB-dependent receptor [Prolixibacteraceae bacterium]